MSKKKPLKSIKTGLFSRGLSLAKISLKTGGAAAKRALQNSVSKETPEAQDKYLIKQMQTLTDEFGELKGSLMKVGQLLSTYGEHFLPPEANKALKQLQSQSPPLAWSEIEKILMAEIGNDRLSQLEIDPEPHAAASIGQVHKARHKTTNEVYAMKVQYPGIKGAIDSDIKYLKMIIGMLNVIPVGDRFDEIFEEVKAMLHQEVNYTIELERTLQFYDFVGDHPHMTVPKPAEEFCSGKVMTTQFIDSFDLDSKEVLALPRAAKSILAEAFLDHYLRELFEYKMVQTDPHFGNYRVIIENPEKVKLVHLDFGAVRAVDDDFLIPYSQLIWGGLLNRDDIICDGASRLGLLEADDPEALKETFLELCQLITEPFVDSDKLPKHLKDGNGNYLFDVSDLPQRIASIGKKIAFDFRLRCPPREVVFLDRKLGGAFTILAHLGCRKNFGPTIKDILIANNYLEPK